jgi:hypothetical protein
MDRIEEAEYHRLLLEKKLGLFLQLAEDIISLSQKLLVDISASLKGKPPLSTRNRVLLGFGLKSFRAFECLVSDARAGKAEAQHHLKSQVESFLYLLWVRKDVGDTNARLVWARGSEERRKYFTKQTEPDSKDFSERYGDNVQQLTNGIEQEWEAFQKKNLSKIAEETNADAYYQRIYRLACDPSHIVDLTGYMPVPGEDFNAGPFGGAYWAYLALNYGCHIMFTLLQAAGEFLGSELTKQVDAFKARRDNIVAMK